MCILISAPIIAAIIPHVKGQTPTLSINPPEVEILEGNNFRVSINITDVTDLYAWDIWVSFDTSQVNFTGAEEGPFLRKVGATLWVITVDYENGQVHMGCSLLGTSEEASGDGILAFLNFICLAPGSSTLHLFDTDLYDRDMNPIPHVTVDGNITQKKRFITLHSEKPLVPVHMHSNESLVPIHMNSNMTLTPVHMHYVGDPEIDPIYEPVCTPWHELYPEYCQMWHLTSWEDYNGDDLLSPNDQIDMTNEETGNVTSYHVDSLFNESRVSRGADVRRVQRST